VPIVDGTCVDVSMECWLTDHSRGKLNSLRKTCTIATLFTLNSTPIALWDLFIIIIIINVVSCHRPFLLGTSLEPAVIPIAQASSFTLQYFSYYV
jgi:hypothetical protein